MRNLEQIRAKNALQAIKLGLQGVNDGDVVNKVPPMIRNSGILAAAAFAYKKGIKGEKNEEASGYLHLFHGIIKHLADRDISLTKTQDGNPKQVLAAWINEVTQVDASVLRSITDETLAFLNYVRRFYSDKE